MPNKRFFPLTCFPHASPKKLLLETFAEKKKFPPLQTLCSFISLILYEPFAKSENKEDTADISENMQFSYGIQQNKIHKKQPIIEL